MCPGAVASQLPATRPGRGGFGLESLLQLQQKAWPRARTTRSLETRLEAYDCSNPTAIENRALDMSALTCQGESVTVKHTVNSTYHLLVKEKTQRLKGYRCELLDSRNVQYCGTYDHQTNYHRYAYADLPKPPTAEQCRKMVREGYMVLPDGTRLDVDKGQQTMGFYEEVGHTSDSGNAIGSNNQVSCVGGDWRIGGKILNRMIVDHNVKVTLVEEEFLWDGTNLVAVSDNTKLPCVSSEKVCHSPTATYMWEYQATYCPLAVSKTVTGIVATDDREREVFMSTDGNLVRVILDHQEVICGQMVYATNYPELYFVAKDYNAHFRQLTDPLSVSMTTFVMNRDDYLYNHLLGEINQELNAVLKHNCEVHRRESREEYYVKHSNPGIVTYGFGNGTFATAAGEVLYYHTCQKVLVTAIELEECYDAMPVVLPKGSALRRQFNETTQWFVEPLTRRLTRYASVVPCTRHFASKYQTVRGSWITATPEIHSSERPKPMARPEEVLVKMEADRDFSRGGVFKEKDMKAWEAFAFIGRIREATTSRLAQEVSDQYKRGAGDPLFQTPSSWLAHHVQKALAALTVWGQVSSGVIGVVFIMKGLVAVASWCYGGRQIYGTVTSALWAALWTMCPTLFLLRERQRAHRAEVPPQREHPVAQNFLALMRRDEEGTEADEEGDSAIGSRAGGTTGRGHQRSRSFRGQVHTGTLETNLDDDPILRQPGPLLGGPTAPALAYPPLGSMQQDGADLDETALSNQLRELTDRAGTVSHILARRASLKRPKPPGTGE